MTLLNKFCLVCCGVGALQSAALAQLCHTTVDAHIFRADGTVEYPTFSGSITLDTIYLLPGDSLRLMGHLQGTCSYSSPDAALWINHDGVTTSIPGYVCKVAAPGHYDVQFRSEDFGNMITPLFFDLLDSNGPDIIGQNQAAADLSVIFRDGGISMHSPEHRLCDLSVYDASGGLIMTRTIVLDPSGTWLNLGSLPTGIYAVRVLAHDREVVRRIYIGD